MKNILLISYYFEPCQAIGAKRWSEFFTLFNQDEEYTITVLTANWKGIKVQDPSVHYIGDEIEFKPFKSINKQFTFLDTIKHPSIYFKSIDKMMLKDSWLIHAKEWVDAHKSEQFDIIIASFTPINAIRLGTYAKNIYKCKYFVDMRDMMSLQGQKVKIPLLHYIDNCVDKYWLKSADGIFTVGPTICEKASTFYKKPVHLIYNAFMGNQYIPHVQRNEFNKTKKIVFSYLGTMGNKRNPRQLIEWIERFFTNHKEYKAEINFASQDNPHDFIQDLEINSIEIHWLGYLKKQEISQLKLDTDIFLLLEDTHENGKENVTGKVFEYLVEQKPVIAFCHPDSDIKNILSNSGVGKIMSSYEECENFLLTIFENKFEIDHQRILQFSRENQFEFLKKLL